MADYFHLVSRIVEERKYFDVSRAEIVRYLEAKGEFDVEAEHKTVDDFENEVPVVLRINIHCKHPIHREGWTLALKLHNTRIDGCDWEPRFTACDGTTAAGWHRHEWDSKRSSAERRKIPLHDFDGMGSREEFLVRCFNLLRIDLSATDYGTDLLPLD